MWWPETQWLRCFATAQNANAHKATCAHAPVGPQHKWQSAAEHTSASVYISSLYHPASLMRFQMATKWKQLLCHVWMRQAGALFDLKYANCSCSFFFHYYCGSVCLCTCLRTPGSCSTHCRSRRIILSVLHQFPADVLVHINGVMKRQSNWGVLNNSPTNEEKSVTSVHDNQLQPTGPWQTEANTDFSSLNAKWEVAGTHHMEVLCALFSTRNSL